MRCAGRGLGAVFFSVNHACYREKTALFSGVWGLIVVLAVIRAGGWGRKASVFAGSCVIHF